MGTQGNLEKVDCGSPDVTPALCSGVVGSYPPQALGPMRQMNTEAMCELVSASKYFYFTTTQFSSRHHYPFIPMVLFMYTTSLVKEAGLQMKYIPLTPKNALNLCD